MTPFDFLPNRVDVIFPEIRIGNSIAKRRIKVSQALEYLRTGMYREAFSDSGQFIGIVYDPQTIALPTRAIREILPPVELPGIRFEQPAGAAWRNHHRVIMSLAYSGQLEA